MHAVIHSPQQAFSQQSSGSGAAASRSRSHSSATNTTSRARRSRRCSHAGFGSRCDGAQRNIAFTMPIKLLQLGQLLLQAPRLTRARCLQR